MQPDTHKAEKERNNREKIYLIVIFLQLICIGVLIWQLIDKGQSNEVLAVDNLELAADKQDIERDLDALELDFSNLQTDNQEMQAQIDSQMVKINQFKAELEAADGDQAKMQRAIYKLRKETETLRSIMQHYVVTIDSLNTLNVELRQDLAVKDEQLDQANSNLDEMASENANLDEKVKIGSRLETESIVSEAKRMRSGGGQANTNRAKNTDMIVTSFGVRANSLAKAGARDYYIRIISPNGSVLSPPGENNQFDWNGGSGLYSVKYNQAYKNEAQTLTVYYEVEQDELPKGKYLIQIYSDGSNIGSTYLNLK